MKQGKRENTFTRRAVLTNLLMPCCRVRICRNGQQAWDNLTQQPQLKDKVYIPKIYPEYSTKRVLVCEWVDGVQLTDVEKISALGLDYKEAMRTSIEAFASQIFLSGFVHGKIIG
jgi:aarF domain-containing kinase